MSKDLENSKCQDILTAAKTLFWKHGINRVSVKEICEVAGASKMTFYRFFDNKTDLVITILNLLMDKGMEDYNAIMSKKIPFAEKVKEMLIVKFNSSQDVSKEFLLDVYKGQDLEVLEHLTKQSKLMENKMLDDFEQAQKEGAIRPHVKRAFISYQLQKLREMVSDKTLLVHYDNPQDLIMEVTDYFFYGLLIHKENK